MINAATANLFAQYKRWADHAFLEGLAGLPAGELSRERAGPMKTMIATLNHVYVVDRIWRAHLEGREHGFQSRQEIPFPSFEELRLAQEESDDWYVAWAAMQTDASLNRSVDFRFVSGMQGSMTAGAMLMHVVNHGSYHRGWLVQMCFEIPAMPAMTDLSIYLTEVAPHACAC
ncbi:DinB family protein [Pseudomonas sp. PDNC002]|uniref:DinB family protein n=1 Tax=Pseudomonas sp. PDNC002 TaxID=2811422 RepID=UPI0019630AC6|nr:DinB family protein [Pseudomonas sp. PDNC002]QRY77277.1 DinB family protein [Pseudomonas sp. PDNC002]